MEKVSIGTMLPGAQMLTDETRENPIWKASIKTHDRGTIVAYVKITDHRKIFIECVCAIVGRRLGIPIPPPCLVNIPFQDYSDIVDADTLGFGSEDVELQSIRKPLNDNEEFVLNKLKQYPKTRDCAAFDEWIANADRNVGNILFGGNDDFIFIDHELAVPENMNVNKVLDNILGNLIAKDITEFEKRQIFKHLNDNIITDCNNLPFPAISSNAYASQYLAPEIISSAIKFLEERSRVVSKMMHDRLKIGQQRAAL